MVRLKRPKTKTKKCVHCGSRRPRLKIEWHPGICECIYRNGNGSCKMIVAAKILFDGFLWSRCSETNPKWMEAAFRGTPDNLERAEINADACAPPDSYTSGTWYSCKLYNTRFWIGVGIDADTIICVG